MANQDNNNRIDYIEFIVSDIAAAKRFYGEGFAWSFTDYGPDYCEFQDGRLSGGFTIGGQPKTSGPLVILYADNLEATQQRLEKLGAKIVKPIFSFPGGRRFHFTDPSGYELAVWSKN